jgi:hypothetical protein
MERLESMKSGQEKGTRDEAWSPIDNNEVSTNSLTHRFHNFHSKFDSIFIAPSPLIGSFVCLLRDELIDEISLRAHDLQDPWVRFEREERE